MWLIKQSMAETNQAKYTNGAFIFICSVEQYLTADGKLQLSDCLE